MPKRLIAIAALLVSMAACGGEGPTAPVTPAPPPPAPAPPPAPPPAAPSAKVSIVPGAQVLTTTAYNPNPITVSTGTTITWMNDDTIIHTSTANGGSWNSGTLAPGASFSKTFDAAGTFPYHCTIHPNMVGTVTVQ